MVNHMMAIGSDLPRHAYAALFVVVFATFMDMLDVGIVLIALPTIQQDMGATYATAQWVLAGYALAFAVLLVPAGRLGDRFGRKRVFQVGVAGFTATSVACGFAPTPGTLVLFRLLQGCFGALMVPQVLALIQVMFPPARRAGAFLTYGLAITLAQLAGPLLGGVLAGLDVFGLGWRMIFLINLPVGLLILAAAARWVPESRAASPLRPDLVGVALVAVISGLLMYPLQNGREAGWPSWMVGLLVAGAPALVLLIWWEWRRRASDALIPVGLFRLRSFSAGTAMTFLLFLVMVSASLIVIWFVQIPHRRSPLETALIMLPWFVGIAICGGLSANLAARLGRALIGTGMLVIAAGITIVSLVIRASGADLPWTLGVGLFVVGCGIGLVMPSVMDVVLLEIPPDDAGAGSGLLNAVDQFAAAAGVGMASLIFFGLLGSVAPAEAERAARELSTAVPASQQQQVDTAFRACLAARATAPTPFAEPLACAVPEARHPAAQAAATAAVKRTFAAAASTTLWFHVAVLLLAAALTPLLPRRREPAGAPNHPQRSTT